MDRVDFSISKFVKANRHKLTLPFKELMRKQGFDPVEAAPRVRNRRQEPKK